MTPSGAQKIILVGLVFILIIEEDMITKLVTISRAAFKSKAGNVVQVSSTSTNPPTTLL